MTKRLFARNNPKVFCLVDDEDYEKFSSWTWMAKPSSTGALYFQGWPYRKKVGNRDCGKTKYFYLHRLILDIKKGFFVDHKDGNSLNNLKSNLRICTLSQNSQNKNGWKNKQYKGVYKYTTSSGIVYKVYVSRKYVGQFKCKHQAALLYDLAAKAIYGEFARCNLLDHGAD